MAANALRPCTLGFTIALIAAAPGSVFAQAAVPPETVDDLRAPPSPAFVVLGIAPTTVERPQGVRPLVMSIIAASKDTGFPRNYSVEVAPYWMGTPGLSFAEYYRRTPKNIYRQLSISVATTPIGESGADGTAIGFGVRTLPLPGRAHPQLAVLTKQLLDLMAERQELISSAAVRPSLIQLLRGAQGASAAALVAVLETKEVASIVASLQGLVRNERSTRIQIRDLLAEAEGDKSLPEDERKRREEERSKKVAALKQRFGEIAKERAGLATTLMLEVQKSKAADQLTTANVLEVLSSQLELSQEGEVERLETEIRGKALRIQDLDRQRVGLTLALATAGAWEIPANDTAELAFTASSLWVTSGYRFLTCPVGEADKPCSSSVDLLGVVRYKNDRRADPADRAWELGARAVWQPVRPFAVSLEWVGRAGADEDRGSRLVGVAEYQFNDTAYLYASFGRDFQEEGVRRNLVSAIGLTFGFGKKPIVEAPVER